MRVFKVNLFSSYLASFCSSGMPDFCLSRAEGPGQTLEVEAETKEWKMLLAYASESYKQVNVTVLSEKSVK